MGLRAVRGAPIAVANAMLVARFPPTADDVEAACPEYRPSTIASTLSRLVAVGALRLVRMGSTRPPVYEIADEAILQRVRQGEFRQRVRIDDGGPRFEARQSFDFGPLMAAWSRLRF